MSGDIQICKQPGTKVGVLETGLLEWSKRLTDWQRDLLRRLAAGEVIGVADYRAYADAAERAELKKTAPWYKKARGW